MGGGWSLIESVELQAESSWLLWSLASTARAPVWGWGVEGGGLGWVWWCVGALLGPEATHALVVWLFLVADRHGIKPAPFVGGVRWCDVVVWCWCLRIV